MEGKFGEEDPIRERIIVENEDELDKLQEDGRVLSEAERRGYQRLVGSLLWIGGLRHGVAYALAYLSGFGKNPRVHHMRVAEQVLGYL
jgi:hypothetical protein